MHAHTHMYMHTCTHMYTHMRTAAGKCQHVDSGMGAITQPGTTGLGVWHLLCSPPRPPKDTSDPRKRFSWGESWCQTSHQRNGGAARGLGCSPLILQGGKLRPKEGVLCCRHTARPREPARMWAPGSRCLPIHLQQARRVPRRPGSPGAFQSGLSPLPLGQDRGPARGACPTPPGSRAELATNPGRRWPVC